MSSNTQMHIPTSIAGSLANFTGREWVFRRLSAWLQAAKPRTFVLTGPPGSGKSTLAARLVQISSGEVPAITYPPFGKESLAFYQFCQARSDRTLDPLRFIETLSKHLADRYQPFALALIQNGDQGITINASQTVGIAENGAEVRNVVIEKLQIGNRSARTAFDWAVRKPLEQLCTKDFQETILILVDSLDEARTYDPDDNIVTLLGHLTSDEADLPAQVRFLLSSRPDPQVVNTIGQPSLDLVYETPTDANDVRDYAYSRLSTLPEPRRRELAQRIATAANGNFLYARYVLDELPANLDQVTDLSSLALPKDLEDIYRRFLKRELANNLKRWRECYSPLLGAIAIAHGAGLTRTQLASITQLAQSKTDALLQACAQYLVGPQPEGPFRIYHQSFRDFLLDDNEYPVYPAEANQAIARFFLEKCKGNWPTCEDDYALQYTPIHLMEAVQQTDQQRVRQELMNDLITLLTNPDFLKTKAAQLGVDVVLVDLRKALEIVLAHNDLVKALACIGVYRDTIRSQSISQSIFEAVQMGNFERALQRAAYYDVVPRPSGRWEVILQLYLAWEAAEQGDITAAQKVIAAAWPLPNFWGNDLATALLVRTAHALARTANNALDARAWLAQWDLGQNPDGLLQSFSVAQPLDWAKRQARVTELNHQLADFQQLVDEKAAAEAISMVPLLNEETVGGRAAGLRSLLVKLAAEKAGQDGIDRALKLVLPNPYPRYRDIGLVALGVACLSVPKVPWVRQRLQSILRTALDYEGVTFTFDLPAILVAEADKRNLPSQELARYLGQSLSSNDRWGTAMRAHSARAAALFRQGQTAEAVSKLEEATSRPPGFAGYATVTLLSLANRWWEFGLSASTSVESLINEAGRQAKNVRDPQFREERIKLVEAYRKWPKESIQDTETLQAALSTISDPDTRRLYKDHVSARWAGPIDGPNLEGLKALVPTALADGTTLDALLGRLFGLGASQLSNTDLLEAIRLCTTHFTNNRPWELGQWR